MNSRHGMTFSLKVQSKFSRSLWSEFICQQPELSIPEGSSVLQNITSLNSTPNISELLRFASVKFAPVRFSYNIYYTKSIKSIVIDLKL